MSEIKIVNAVKFYRKNRKICYIGKVMIHYERWWGESIKGTDPTHATMKVIDGREKKNKRDVTVERPCPVRSSRIVLRIPVREIDNSRDAIPLKLEMWTDVFRTGRAKGKKSNDDEDENDEGMMKKTFRQTFYEEFLTSSQAQAKIDG